MRMVASGLRRCLSLGFVAYQHVFRLIFFLCSMDLPSCKSPHSLSFAMETCTSCGQSFYWPFVNSGKAILYWITNPTHHPRSCFVPCKLSSVRRNAVYGLSATINGTEIGCAKALVLLTSSKKSELKQFGAGFIVETCGIKDASDEASEFYKTRVVCSLSNSLQFKLDPPRPNMSQLSI